MGYTEKFANQVQGSLRPGERVVAAIRAMPRGATVGMGVGGLVGAAVATRQASKAQEAAGSGTLAAAWPTGNRAVGLTDQRLVLFSFSAMGKAKDLVAEYPLAQIASVTVEKKKIANAVNFGFADGSAIQVESKKLEKDDEFAEAFNRTKGG